ncbi:hypothetical protein F4824DRAFT_489700 [Ustulina deusta]|nr:hypothetical protein F4824DRAFT_489700 [Ustulina deusta]
MFFSRRKKGDKWVLYRLLAKESSNSQSKYVALKIQAANWFILEGPNGEHICFVTEPIGPSTAGVPNAPHEFYDPLPAEFLHHNDVVHGDIQPRNLLFFFPLRDISRLAPTELQQNESNAQLDHIVRSDGRVDRWSPKDLIVLEPVIEGGLQDQEVVKLADLGGVFQINTPPASLVAPVSFRTPDAILLTKSTVPDRPLFEIFGFGRFYDVINNDHLIELSKITGPLPHRIRDAGPRYTCDGPERRQRPTGVLGHSTSFASLEDAFFKYKSNDSTDEKARELSSLLRKILQIESSKRPSAAELLGKQWFRM